MANPSKARELLKRNGAVRVLTEGYGVKVASQGAEPCKNGKVINADVKTALKDVVWAFINVEVFQPVAVAA